MARLPISDLLTTRLSEFDSTFELRNGTGFESLFFKPLQFIVQPLRDEADAIQTAQSFRRILLTEDPDSFDEESVDALASNLFVTRRDGGRAAGVATAFYDNPTDKEYPESGAVFTGSNGRTYSNPAPFRITEAQMAGQIEDGLFFFDIPVQADEPGEDGDLEVGGLILLADDPNVVSVTNRLAIEGGLDRETNTELITRAKNSIGVRDLVTPKGFNAILFENFVDILAELQPIGFGDDEMMRDIVYNVHIGGRVDGYFKAPRVHQGSKDFTGLLIDVTRQSFTSANVQLTGTDFKNVGNPNIDRSNGKLPTVQQIKVSIAATYLSTADLSSPIDLSVNQHVRIEIDGTAKNVRVAGVNPGATTRNEIVSLINEAFGIDIASPEGDSFRLTSPTIGLTSSVVIDNPTIGNSALLEVFDLSPGTAPYLFEGDGPITFVEGVHYEFNDAEGDLKRIIGSTVLATQTTGETTLDSDEFEDATINQFVAVQENDILTIVTGDDAGDYRIIEKLDNNTLKLDAELTDTASGIEYFITRTGIKNNEIVYVQYYFNPLSIDIGKLVKFDEDGKVRGIRTGRETQTITDLAFLRINQIEIIDPITGTPTGEVLDGTGGYGQGGYGQGGYGIGAGADYYMVVNEPHDRFSMFEDSYIVINSGLQGLSFRVSYDYAPEVESLHDFVRSENERVLDGDILMKHFLPAYVSGTITYSVDSTDISIPDNDTLTDIVKDFINTRRAGEALEYSDIIQLITRKTDPFDRFGTLVEPFKLTATIHNADATQTRVTGTSALVAPTLDPFPRDTTHPLSARITHWLADEITLVRS